MSDLLMDCLRRSIAAPVYDVARRTPLDSADNLSRRLGQQIWLKREDLQPSFSFKVRGAYACMHKLVHKCGLTSGVVAASAGNHAQGVARAADKLNLEADIVMPVTTPSIKVEAVRQLGARVHLVGDTYDDACSHAQKLAEQQRRPFVHPFDDADVIAGQGTIGVELLNQISEAPASVFIPVGGGGLLAGAGAVIRALSPNTKIIAVEPEDAACLKAALAADRPVTLERVGIFADGAAVRRVGDKTFALARELVDEVVTVNADEICAAMRDIFEDTRSLVEPAGAMAVAGIKRYQADGNSLTGPTVAINSGANINFSRMGHVVERAAMGRGEEALLSVVIPEQPGSYLGFLDVLGMPAVTEFNYRYRSGAQANVFIGLALDGGNSEPEQTIRRLSEAGYPVTDLSHNELARLHLRHMVGGTPPEGIGERVLRFEFPERPGALGEFLRKLAGRWSISLFHYRNHGAAYGRVLAGFFVEPADESDFEQFLAATGYQFTDETDNPAYKTFLSADCEAVSGAATPRNALNAIS
ncbi:MAG: threonine ammonia-lyase, biosynthetic [Lysobacterales bacterium]